MDESGYMDELVVSGCMDELVVSGSLDELVVSGSMDELGCAWVVWMSWLCLGGVVRIDQ